MSIMPTKSSFVRWPKPHDIWRSYIWRSYIDPLTNQNDQQVRRKFEDWIAQMMEDIHWNAFFLTYMFNHLPGPADVRFEQMTNEIEHFYSTLLTRVVRKPNQQKGVKGLPRLFAVADLPVPKSKKSSISDVSINDGLHCHALLLIPQHCRLKSNFLAHLEENRALYLGSHGKLQRIHAEPITYDPQYIADYLMKSCKRDASFYNGLIVLPKSTSETAAQSHRMSR